MNPIKWIRSLFSRSTPSNSQSKSKKQLAKASVKTKPTKGGLPF